MFLDPVRRTSYDDQLRTQFAPSLPPQNIYPDIPLSAILPAVPATETLASPVPIKSSGSPVRHQGTPWILLSIASGVAVLLIAGVVVLITTMARKEPIADAHREVVERPKEIPKKESPPKQPSGTSGQVAKDVPQIEPASPPKSNAPPAPVTQTISTATEPALKSETNTAPLQEAPPPPVFPARQPSF